MSKSPCEIFRNQLGILTSYDELCRRIISKISQPAFLIDNIFTKKGRLIRSDSQRVLSESNELFGETMDKESDSFSQIPLVYVFPHLNSQCFFFPQNNSGSLDFNAETLLEIVQNPELAADVDLLQAKPGEKMINSSLMSGVIQKVCQHQKQTFSKMLSQELRDDEKIAGILQIAPEAFHMEKTLHELFEILSGIEKVYSFVANRRRNIISLCQGQICGNEVIFVSLASSYKYANQQRENPKS